MEPIKRYTPRIRTNEFGLRWVEFIEESEGDMAFYADHEAKVRELEERLKDRDAEIEELTRTVARIRTEEIKPMNERHEQLEKQKADLEAKLRQVVAEGKAISRLNVEQAVEIGSLKSRLQKAEEERDKYRSLLVSQCELQERLDRAEQEREAYKRAKEENDERFMLERDEARQERDQARARVGELEEALLALLAEVNDITVEDRGTRYNSYKDEVALNDLHKAVVRATHALKGKEEHGI